MAGKAILTCRPNSHPFQERILVLDKAAKIGRSVARSRWASNNAIFDCKVLSRNHALLWYSNGKFYLQDTKSSNGTFVNNQRLSRSGEESAPREIFSGDIVQFGVDVLENSHKVTHGSIVACIKLFLPDGKEANKKNNSYEDLFLLNQLLQEAILREEMLETKLSTLQNGLESIWKAANLGWRAFISEDKLLSRVENLENQIQSYSKDFTEDKLRDELKRMQQDKELYQTAAKEFLHKVLAEKIEVDQRYQEIKRSLIGAETEYSNLCTQMVRSHGDIQALVQKYTAQMAKNEILEGKCQELEEQHMDMIARLNVKNKELEELREKHLLSEFQEKNLLEDKKSDEIIKEPLKVIELEINPKIPLGLIDDEDTSKNDDKYHQPHLSDEVQLKLVSQLQEITDKYTLTSEDIERSKYLEEDICDLNSCGSTITENNEIDHENELLKMKLEESQLVSEQYKLMADELTEQVTSLKRELNSLIDNNIEKELSEECTRLESTVTDLEAKIVKLESEKSKPVFEPSKVPDEPENNLINHLKTRISELQEELITVETMFMSCHEERTALNKQLKSLQMDHQALTNKPYSFLLVTLPCLVAIFAFAVFYSSFIHSNSDAEK